MSSVAVGFRSMARSGSFPSPDAVDCGWLSGWFVGRTSVAPSAESLIGSHTTVLIRRRGPWKGLDDGERTTLRYVDWFDHRRLHSACVDIPPVEFEDDCERSIAGLSEDVPAGSSLRWTRGGPRRPDPASTSRRQH